MWRSKGMDGYRKQINRLMVRVNSRNKLIIELCYFQKDLSKYFTARIKATEGFEMVVEEVRKYTLFQNNIGEKQPEFLNICFWYIPPSMRNMDPEEKTSRLEKVAPKIKARMMQRGTTMVTILYST